MSTARKVVHNTGVQILGKIASTVLGFISIAMMARYLGAEQFGWYVTAISFLQFVGILVDFGTIPVTAQMLGESRYKEKEILQNILTFRVFSAILFLGLAPLVVLFFPYPLEVKMAVAVMSISFLAIAINQVFTGYFQYKLAMHFQALGELYGRAVLVIGLIFLTKASLGFIWIMGLISFASVLYTAYMWYAARKYTEPVFAWNPTLIKDMLSRMWPIAISIMFNVVYLKGDVIILSLFRSQEEVGLYGGAYRVIDILAQTAMLTMGIILPLLAASWVKQHKEQFAHRFRESFSAMMMLGIPMVVGVMLLAEPIMLLVGGEEFLPASVYLIILSIAVFGLYLGAIFGHVAVSINKQKETLWIYISSAILTLVGYLYAIPRFGAEGAAWMSVFSEAYVGLMLFIIVKKLINVRIDLATLIKIIVATAVMGICVFLVQAHVIILTILGLFVYLFVLLITGAITKERIQEITRLS